jgi:hypothetical protein
MDVVVSGVYIGDEGCIGIIADLHTVYFFGT